MKSDSGDELVSVKRILNAEGDDNNFLLSNKGVAGESLSILAKDMANALKLIALWTCLDQFIYPKRKRICLSYLGLANI